MPHLFMLWLRISLLLCSVLGLGLFVLDVDDLLEIKIMFLADSERLLFTWTKLVNKPTPEPLSL